MKYQVFRIEYLEFRLEYLDFSNIGCCPSVGLLLLPLLVLFYVRYLFRCAVLCVLSSFAFFVFWKRGLVALLLMSSGCYIDVIVFLTVPWIGLRRVLVAILGHTHLMFDPRL